METDGSERAAVEAALIWAAGSRAGFGQPLSKSIKALDWPSMLKASRHFCGLDPLE